MKEWLDQHAGETIGVIIGLLLAICFLVLGFLSTIFLVVLAIIGGLVGHYWPLLQQLHDK